ncbi:Alpha/beta hydrolase-3 [Quillaja saponaria]|uniref:Alpha/beta hydrolase-3 n=1 Tax=Quillaja saponaria TaxID=32244 RepID=A0AAD7VH71_QUISA|nr:Alpha/beta hydrolase-3 [Quillaja saponaria]
MVKSDSSEKQKLFLPWKTRISISFLSFVANAALRSDGTINRRLLNFLDRESRANPNPINGVKSFDITIDPTCNLWFRLFIPTATTSKSLIATKIQGLEENYREC